LLNLFIIACAIMAVTCLSMGIFVLLKGSKKQVNEAFFLFCIALFVWSVCLGFLVNTTDMVSGLFLAKLEHFGVIFITPAYLHTVMLMTGWWKKRKKLVYAAYAYGLLLVVCNLSGLLVTGVSPRGYFKGYADPGIAYPFLLLLFVVCMGYGFYLLYDTFRKETGFKRNQLRYVLIGSLIGYAGGLPTYLPVYGTVIPPYTMYMVPVFYILFGYAIAKYHLLDIKIGITRASLFFVVYAFVMGIPFYLLYHIDSQITTVIVAMVLATIGPILYRKLQQKSENLLLAKQRQYQKLLRNVSKEMLRVRDLDKLLPYIVESVTNAVNPEFSAIYLAHEGDYVLKAWRKVNPEPAYATIPASHPMIKVLKNVGPIVFYEEMKENISEISLPLHLLISLNVDNRLVGILLLGKKMDGDMYSSDDLDVFEILARQAALAIDYCTFNRDFQNNQRKKFGDELRASVAGMAKTVAHQMVNQLSKFSMPAQYLIMESEKFMEANEGLVKANPALQDSVNEVVRVSREIEINVQKARNMLDKMNYFVKFQSEIANAHDFLQVRPLIDIAIEEVRTKHARADIPINISVEDSAKIYGIKSMVYDTLFNLLDNAYGAVEAKIETLVQPPAGETYVPSITIALEEHADNAVISITDNGIGINGKIYDKVCSPFFTSKPSASASIGIGLYMVKCMVEEIHNGKLWFESEYGVGSVFYVSFPHSKNN
jgi:K+-sensing histidine kinase KdpD